jgi:hypothetical protein
VTVHSALSSAPSGAVSSGAIPIAVRSLSVFLWVFLGRQGKCEGWTGMQCTESAAVHSGLPC